MKTVLFDQINRPKALKSLVLSFACWLTPMSSLGQGIIGQSLEASNSDLPISCGSHELMKKMDEHNPGFMDMSNQMLMLMGKVENKHQKTEDVKTVQVVFHVVYENDYENLPDSIIQKQLDKLNAAFRGDLVKEQNLREDFIDIVGDSKIEFKLADRDPQGNPTNGITHTQTSITNFGGTLPYRLDQRAEIDQWIQDSIMLNYGRIMSTAQGGIDAWNTDQYLNIWVGDLSIYEPEINHFEEILFLGLATPPLGHEHFKDEPAAKLLLEYFSEGVIMQFNAIGPENPSVFEGLYSQYNGTVNTGNILVHEIGHYLGLRHIWGDGPCDTDDFIHDTPRSSASSQFRCNKFQNTCLDTINGKDLPDMIENFMDYSGSQCQSAFTKGQINVMRSVLEGFRASVVSNPKTRQVQVLNSYPNPSSGTCKIELPAVENHLQFSVTDSKGAVLQQGVKTNCQIIELNLDNEEGLYFIHIETKGKQFRSKVMLFQGS